MDTSEQGAGRPRYYTWEILMEHWMYLFPVAGGVLNLAAAIINLRTAFIKRRARPDESGPASA